MKNIAKEKPSVLTPRLLGTINFVDLSDVQGKRILDIGCGYGWFEDFALKNNVKSVMGTEITDVDLKTAKKHIRDERAGFRVASAIKLPFKNSSFDTVVAWEVLEHIPKDTENTMFKEISRVLKKGGKLYLSTPYASWQSRFFDPAWWLIGHRHYTEKQLKSYALRNSFKISKVSVKGKWWSIVASLDMYISKWILRHKPVMENLTSDRSKKEYSSDSGFKNIYIKMIKAN